jgi:hypothetical protein
MDALGLGRAPRADEYTELFVMQLSPYASIYVGNDGMMGGEARDRVAGFWRALGMTPPAEPDHLTALLGLYSVLRDGEDAGEEHARAKYRHAREALLWEHLLSWIPVYLRRVREVGPAPYVAWADALREALASEHGESSVPDRLPMHLREAPEFPDPSNATFDDILDAVLTPIKSGIVLTRHDLASFAHESRLGNRQGERRFILQALIAQDGPAVLRWLETEARRQQHEGNDTITQFWSGRAARTEHVLRTMRHTVEATHAGYAER